jgi:hypothetical protein
MAQLPALPWRLPLRGAHPITLQPQRGGGFTGGHRGREPHHPLSSGGQRRAPGPAARAAGASPLASRLPRSVAQRRISARAEGSHLPSQPNHIEPNKQLHRGSGKTPSRPRNHVEIQTTIACGASHWH